MSSLKKNYFYNLIYRVVVMVTPLITSPYISRVLGADYLGRYSYTFAVSNYFMIFAALGISDYGNRAIAQTREIRNQREQVFSEILSLQIILSIICVLAYYFYSFTFSDFKLLSFIQGLNVISVLFDVTWFLFGMELFVVTTVRNLCVKIGAVVLILLFVKKPEDVWIYALIMAGSTLLGNLMVVPLLRKYVSFKIVKPKDVFKHLKPNLVLFLPVVANNMLHYFDKIMLGVMAPESELGCYDNAEKLLTIPNSIVTALGAVMLPRVSNYVANGKKDDIQELIRKTLLFVVFVSTALAFGISSVSKEFVPFFFGKGYDLVIPLVYVLAPYVILISWATMLKTQVLLPNKMDKVFVFCLCLGAATNAVLNFILIPYLGAIGAAIATTISEALIVIVETVIGSRKYQLWKFVLNALPFFVIGTIMSISIWNISFSMNVVTLIVKIVIGAFIYLSLSFLYMNKFHRDVLKALLKK